MRSPAISQLQHETRSNVPAMLLNLAAVAAAIASLASDRPTDHPLWTGAVILWLAYFQHTWTTIFHEDAHYSLYPSRRWQNIMNGTIVGTLLLVPFTVYRQVHIRHHSKMNGPDDFELWPYCDPKTSLRFRRIFVIFDLLLGVWVGPYIYGRIFFVKGSPLTDRRLRRRITLEYLLILIVWSAIVGVVAYYGAWLLFAKIYLIPAWLTGMIQTIRKLTEHLGLPAGNPMAGARTVLAESPLGRLVSYTSFDIIAHGLHHEYPQMPHARLREAYALEKKSPPDAPVYPSYWRAMRDMMPHLARPAIGANLPS